MIYVASPYSTGAKTDSDEDKAIRQRRYEMVKKYVASNIDQNLFSPIIYWHDIAEQYDLPVDPDTYWKKNRDYIRRCDTVLILNIANDPDWPWDSSEGVKQEGTFAMSCGIPVHKIDFYDENLPLPRELKEALEKAQQLNNKEEVNDKPH